MVDSKTNPYFKFWAFNMAVFFFQQLYFSNILNLNMIEPCPSILATNPISGCSVWSPGLPTATTHLLVALNPCRTLLILPHIGDRLQPHSIPKVPRRGSGISVWNQEQPLGTLVLTSSSTTSDTIKSKGDATISFVGNKVSKITEFPLQNGVNV